MAFLRHYRKLLENWKEATTYLLHRDHFVS